MAKFDDDDLDEKPLDPEVEKVRRKMVRLLVLSIGIMIVGVMAVLAAVVYRVMTPGESEAAAGGVMEQPLVSGTIRGGLPEGFSVQEVALDGGRILFFGKGRDGRRRALIVDIVERRVAADIALD